MFAARITASVTRPADTTQYADGDVVGELLTFEPLPRYHDQGARIEGAACISSANQATKPDLELYLFTEAPTVAADNAAFAPTDAELEKLVGIVEFGSDQFKAVNAGAGAAGNAAASVGAGVILAAQPALYGVLVARNAYTPVSEEQFTVALEVRR